MTDLRSAAVPPAGPEDHQRGPDGALTLVTYSDLECPHCAVLHLRLEDLLNDPAGPRIRMIFRHFPSRSRHPRAWPAAAAAEAAGLQGRFWEMHDLLFADQGRLEDPHLWERAQRLGLDVDRFDSDRRSDLVLERVKRDFEGGVRAGVVSTPTVFADGHLYSDAVLDQLLAGLSSR